MSNITALSEQERMNKKSFHRRNNSSELDVFEAAQYFSGGANEVILRNNGGSFTQNTMKEQSRMQGGSRITLDNIPNSRNSIPSQSMARNSIPSQTMEKPNSRTSIPSQIMKEKKYMQPSSPGGRLASFLNSLFSQTSSRKKQSKSSCTQSLKDNEEDSHRGSGRRKRRTSISHFQSSSSTISDSKSIYSTSSTFGFRTPPPVLTNFSKSISGQNKEVFEEKRSRDYANWLDEKSKFKFSNGFSEKHKNLGNEFLEKGNKNSSEEREIKKFNHEVDDDGGDSDSSSDLFELRNCDLGYYSSGLPVYETTHMNSITKGAPISGG